MSFNTKSYELHSNTYKDTDVDKAKQWTNKDTVDYWRHKRMYDTLLPILTNYPNASWLTVGDGKYGTDANYLLGFTPNVLATDIAEDCLKMAKESGFIPNYKIENAEKLSFEDNTFDFALVKEAYHHFPRPSIALYEMLRVSKKGIVLIEPNDPNAQIPQKFSVRQSFFWFIQSIKNKIKKLLGRESYYSMGNYEPVGNFVYSISEREIEKVALGLNYDLVAFKGINDDYIEGVEYELLKDHGPKYQTLLNTIQNEDKKVKEGKRIYGIITAIIFKEMPDESCMKSLMDAGYSVTKLSKNPYI